MKNDDQIKDYIPFMDVYPELELVPTTSVNIPIFNFSKKYDYIQNIERKGDNGHKETFHLLVKDRKFGVLYYNTSSIFDKIKVALPASYDSIEFLGKKKKAFVALVKCTEKYGLFFWKYGFLTNDTLSIPTEYDSLEFLNNNRIKGIRNGQITYFDETGHILK